MKELFTTPAAEADLLEIWVYLLEANERTADRLINEITDKFEMLCAYPNMGRSRDEVAANYRSLPAGNYVIFYRALETKLEISRVLHGSRDISGLFTAEDEAE